MQSGARKVYALDVRYGQLAWRLREDKRVVVIERTNIRYYDGADLDEQVDLAVIDASFISFPFPQMNRIKTHIPAMRTMSQVSIFERNAYFMPRSFFVCAIINIRSSLLPYEQLFLFHLRSPAGTANFIFKYSHS